MADDYTPPKVWTQKGENGGQFASINRPVAGPTHDNDLPVGKHPLQLYSLATPNGQKVTIMLEELLEAGHDAEYDAWLIRINEGHQFGSGFGLGASSYVKAEYRYSNYGDFRVGDEIFEDDGEFDIDLDRHQVLVGLGVRF